MSFKFWWNFDLNKRDFQDLAKIPSRPQKLVYIRKKKDAQEIRKEKNAQAFLGITPRKKTINVTRYRAQLTLTKIILNFHQNLKILTLNILYYIFIIVFFSEQLKKNYYILFEFKIK